MQSVVYHSFVRCIFKSCLQKMKRPLKIAVLILLVVSSFGGVAASNPPIQFIENRNQWPAQVYFGADVRGARIFFLSDGIIFNLYSKEATGHISKPEPLYEDGYSKGSYMSTYAFKINFVGSNKPVVIGKDKLLTTYNYYLRNDASRWGSGAQSFSLVEYKNVYNGIDLRIHSHELSLKSDWIVEPCADPNQIRLQYEGVQQLSLLEGNLIIKTQLNEITELEPYAFQMINGEKKSVRCEYKIVGDQTTFVFPEGYDANYELVIDPILIFSGYSGSTFDNWGNTATYDSKGNLYSGGMVTNIGGGNGFPATIGAYQTFYAGGNWDVAILKYDSSGANVLYATYLGGTGTETPQSLVVNKDNELLILGATSSPDFPVTNSSSFKGGVTVDPLWGVEYVNGSDLFIVKLKDDGSALVGGTYLGGTKNDGLNFVSGYMYQSSKVESAVSKNYGDQLRGDIIADLNGNVYIASNTLSFDFPIVNSDPNITYHGGSHDAVVVKLTPDLSSIIWSRFMGGAGTDASYSIKLNQDNEVYVAGGTTSVDFGGMNGLHTTSRGNIDGWIAKLSANGDQILNGTYLGTPSYDQAYFIDLATDGGVVAFGQTQGSYPVQGNVYSKPNSGQFLHKLSADLKTTIFSTVIGSGSRSPDISPTAFLVSECNTIYLSGWGGDINSPNSDVLIRNYVGGSTFNLPITNDAYQKETNGNDFYLMVLSGDASEFIYGTFFGGNSSLTHVDGGTSRFDKKGIVYHAVCAGCGGQSDFPAVNVPLERQKNKSSNCNNAAFKFDLSLLKARIQTNNIDLSQPGYREVCYPDSIVFQNRSIGGKIYLWDFGDGTSQAKTDIRDIAHQYNETGKYKVKLKTLDQGTCIGKDSTYVTINVYKPLGFASEDQTICFGSSAQLAAGGGVSYEWTAKDGEFKSQIANPSVTPNADADYFVSITDFQGCLKKDTVLIEVVPAIDLKYELKKKFLNCSSRPLVEVTNLSNPAEEVFFDFGDGTTSDLDQVLHEYEKDSIYRVRLIGKKEFCIYEKYEEIPIYTLKVPNVITPEQSPGKNDMFKIIFDNQPISKAGIQTSLIVYNRWGEGVYFNDDYKENWSGEGLASGVYYYEVKIDQEQLSCKGWVHVIK